MKDIVILDTGPLVASVNRRDAYHAWATEQLTDLAPPLLTCDAVLAEACYLLRDTDGGSRAVLELLERGVMASDFPVAPHAASLKALMAKYSGVPMSLADACLVRLSELHDHVTVMTLDHDFLIYRRHSRQGIPLLMPS
jgi:uncharacterized protein